VALLFCRWDRRAVDRLKISRCSLQLNRSQATRAAPGGLSNRCGLKSLRWMILRAADALRMGCDQGGRLLFPGNGFSPWQHQASLDLAAADAIPCGAVLAARWLKAEVGARVACGD
jgi:hypothetical protein